MNEISIPFIIRFFPNGNGRLNPRGVLAVNPRRWTVSYIFKATFLFLWMWRNIITAIQNKTKKKHRSLNKEPTRSCIDSIPLDFELYWSKKFYNKDVRIVDCLIEFHVLDRTKAKQKISKNSIFATITYKSCFKFHAWNFLEIWCTILMHLNI